MNTWGRDREVEKAKTKKLTPAQRRQERRTAALKRGKEDLVRLSEAIAHCRFVLGEGKLHQLLLTAQGGLILTINALEEAK